MLRGVEGDGGTSSGRSAFFHFRLLCERLTICLCRLAVASALNKLTARTFRERGKRREMVQDLIDDLERLFLQGKIVDDEAKRKAFVGYA